MAGWKRRILGITVISAGVCAALPFRSESVQPPVATHSAAESPGVEASRNELTLRLTIPAAPVAVPQAFGGQQPISTVTTTKPTAPPDEVRRDGLQAPPSLASTFQPLVTTSAVEEVFVDKFSVGTVSVGTVSVGTVSVGTPVETFPVAATGTAPVTNRDETERRHRIADGDTLEAIAERYLGERKRWLAILEANEGLLADPNILPIGEEILIPQIRQPLPDADAEDDHLVPIPPGLLGRE